MTREIEIALHELWDWWYHAPSHCGQRRLGDLKRRIDKQEELLLTTRTDD